MLNCFKNRDRGPSTNNPSSKDRDPIDIEAVILIPGHNRSGRSRGMTTYNGIVENDFNSILAERILAQSSLNHDDTRVPVHVLYRNSDSYGAYCIQIKKDVKKLCRDHSLARSKVLVIELHLNAAGIPEAHGCEALVHNHKSARAMMPVINIFSEQFTISKRGNYSFTLDGTDHNYRGIKKLKRGSRGSGFLRTMQSIDCMACVFEPFFADYRNDDNAKFLDDKSRGIDFMTDFWMDMLKLFR